MTRSTSGVCRALGILLLGVFASKAVNAAGGVGFVHGSGTSLGRQFVEVVACSTSAFAFTYAALKLIKRITPVRVGGEAEPGLDEAMHVENASHKRDRLTAHPACTLGSGMFEPFDPTLIGRDRPTKISRMRCRSHRGFRSNRE